MGAKVPELDRSVFVIPASEFKGKRAHVLVLNDVASKIIEECRGTHDEIVLVWRRERVKNVDEEPAVTYSRVHTMNNTAFHNARRAAKLDKVRVHDLRHTFVQRLRDVGVSEEDRALLLGHAITGMPQHDATATIARRVDGRQGDSGARRDHAAARGQRPAGGLAANSRAERKTA